MKNWILILIAAVTFEIVPQGDGPAIFPMIEDQANMVLYSADLKPLEKTFLTYERIYGFGQLQHAATRLYSVLH